VRQGRPRHQEGALEVAVDHLVPGPLGLLQRGAVRHPAGPAGVVDQHVDGRADLGEHPVDGGLHVLAAGHVRLPPADPELGGGAFQHLGAAPEDHHLVTPPGQGGGHGPADPGAAAGHHRDARVHGPRW
jgi:hypothetical protein